MNTVTLHCKPYVKNWLTANYGNPVCLKSKSNFKNQLTAALVKQFMPSDYFNKQLYTASVEIQIDGEVCSRLGSSIAPQLHHLIHNVIREQIECELFIFVEANVNAGSSIKEAIDSYQMIYNFYDSFSSEAISQTYYRYKRNLKNIFRKSVSKKSAA